MSDFPRVSIVIPTYNQADLLRSALESVISQTEQSWEALIIDNTSDDHTARVVREFGDPRIKFLTIQNEGVIAKSRNHGIHNASGPWIAFLDSDDLWAPDKLEKCLQAVGPDCDLICHRENTIRGDQVVGTSPLRSSHWPNYRNLLFYGNCFSPTAVIVRSNSLKLAEGFSEKPEFVTVEDYDLWLRLLEQGLRVKFIPDVLSSYRLHDSNQSSSVLRHRDAGLKAVAFHYNRLQPKQFLDSIRFKSRIATLLYAAGRSFHAAGKRKQALHHYLKSLLQYPFRLKVYAAAVMTLFSSSRAE